MRSFTVVLAVAFWSCLPGCERTGVQLDVAATSAALTLPPGFQDQVVVSGLSQPTAVRFAKDGRIFIAEKSGLIKLFDPASGAEPSVLADLRTQVHNYWDRGLLDLELDPSFPDEPYLYVLYVHDGALDETAPRWGRPGATSDRCPTPPGPQTLGCVVSGRLSRLEVAGSSLRGAEQVLVEDWPMQFPSHSLGSLLFGPDGMLYVSAGDGASFDFVDYGQSGDPQNVLGDPPVAIGQAQVPPAARGGALRAQNLAEPGFPVRFNGKILRLDPRTGRAAPGNPLESAGNADAASVVAIGLRNPFRMTFRPGSAELWIADVGWGGWEEIDRLELGSSVANFGWPCYEGDARQPAYEATNLDACNALYARGDHVAPYYAYRHGAAVVEADGCGAGAGSIAGVAFYEDGLYPAEYRGALFFADYARNCIYALMPGPDGLPNPGDRRVFGVGTAQPVQLLIGPGNDLYYTSVAGELHRIAALGANHAPLAAFVATPEAGVAPVTLVVSAQASSDPDPGDSVSFAWDLDGDGSYDDATGVSATYLLSRVGEATIGLKVRDSRGAEATTTRTVNVSGTGGIAQARIDRVEPRQFEVGQLVRFEGSGIEAGLPLPAASLHWDVVLQHCPVAETCHPHVIESFEGERAELSVPDHEYPYHLQLILRVTGSDGRQSTAVERLDPRTVDVTLDSAPRGLLLAFNQSVKPTPFSTTVAFGSANTISAPDYAGFRFTSWSSELGQTALFHATDATPSLLATYDVSSSAAELEQLGKVIARVMLPASGGSRDLDVIRDDDRPSPGSADGLRQYDSFLVDDLGPKEDWIGYELAAPHVFSSVVFQEGRNFGNGGWFEALEVRVRNAGNWSAVRGLDIEPSYPGTSDRVGFRTYRMAFEPAIGDAIAVFGPAGGAAHFVSCAELDVYGRRATLGTELAPVAQPAPRSGEALAGQRVTLDASASFDLDGDPLDYLWTQTDGPAVTLSDPTTARASFVAPRVEQPTRLRFALTVRDVALASDPAHVEVVVAASMAAVDISERGRVLISEPAPSGGGNPNIEIIRDGIEPAIGSTDSASQYDTFTGDRAVGEGFVGYAFDQAYRFSRIRFQTGRTFLDGGWLDSLKVQVRQGGRYRDVDGLRSAPDQANASSAASYQTYALTFTPALGDAIRIYGSPGGLQRFFSVAELRAFAVGAAPGNALPLAVAGPDFGAPDGTEVALDGSLSWDPEGSPLQHAWQQIAGPYVALSEVGAASPRFVTPFAASPTELTFRLIVRDEAQGSIPDDVSVRVERRAVLSDVTDSAEILASARRTIGAGNPDLEVIRDRVYPADDALDPAQQWTSFTGQITGAGWVGYQLSSPQALSELRFQEGVHFHNGGWFEALSVQVLRAGVWREVDGLTVRPNYLGHASGRSWQRYELSFTPTVAEGIRLHGVPGGDGTYFSVAELRAYAP